LNRQGLSTLIRTQVRIHFQEYADTGLAADYQGWEGERVWRTYDGDLAVSAVFRTGGHVGLSWTLRPWPNATGGWNASVTTWLEAGEQMSSLASDVEDFLSGEQP
jgi:hypothetical protein